VKARDYKIKAKAAMATRNPNIIAAGAIFVVVSVVFSFFVNRICYSGFTYENIERLTYYSVNGDIDNFLSLYQSIMPTAWAEAIRAVVNFLLSVLEIGLIIFIFNKIRRTGQAMYANLLDGFSVFGRYLLLYVLKGLFIALWSLLLIVPGIIAAYRYRMAEYIMLDHPEYSAMQCIKESKEMMKGRKWSLFCLDFSFIGWIILSTITPIADLWSVPYMNSSYVMFYESIAYPDRYAEYPQFGEIIRPVGPGM